MTDWLVKEKRKNESKGRNGGEFSKGEEKTKDNRLRKAKRKVREDGRKN